MKPFKRRRRGGIVGVFEPTEAHLLRNLLGQVVELLQDRTGPSESSPDPLFDQLAPAASHLPPEDPVLHRLLPDGYSDDDEASGDFRRYTERGLSTAKVANAEVVIESLVRGGMDPDDADTAPVEVELDPGEVQSWLRSLTDLRLALAVRLGIETEEDAEAASESDDEQTVVMSDIYDWLGYVQETLVGAID
ncbi:DUF2017 domain-containing protein [Solicola sp. PLA-1-18]|uniref:DUF2017 domain-containing protein n=1 Tax=Solicola sp. PLA-1-18 TaxID=3380532 RepID=UPI003B7E4E13